MTTLSLIARFPLGVYYGHKPDHNVDRVPSPARLHSALLNAAAQGSHARLDKGKLVPSEESLAALRWLEQNPPTGLYQPESLISSTNTSRFIFREVSSINKKRRTEKRRVSDGVAFADGVGYQWTGIPEEIARVVTRLAEDVSCLGESTSVVVLEPGEFTPNLELDADGSPFELGGNYREVPLPGRTDELIAAHEVVNPRKLPTVAADKYATSEEPRPSSTPRRNLTEVRYRRLTTVEVADVPWVEAHFVALSREFPESQRVELCTAMHKALIATIPDPVSPMITGKYLDGAVARPANRLAIQYLPTEVAALFGLRGPALALFIPREALAEDIDQIGRIRQLSQLWGRRIGKVAVEYSGESAPGHQFWPAVRPGHQRLWRPLTPVIPETRPIRMPEGMGEWTLADSGLLSLGFVWRDDAETIGSGQKRYLELRDFAASRGAFVAQAHSVGGRTAHYVHRMSESLVARAWTGLFHLGTLADDRTAVMVGQSRHLGGGLLVPFDVPDSILEFDSLEEGQER